MIRLKYLITCLSLALLLLGGFDLFSIESVMVVFAQDEDRDSDGIPDRLDSCPDQPGSRTNNGCPVDSDGDGIPDDADQCPSVAGVATNNGCPEETNNPAPIPNPLPQPTNPEDLDGDGTPNADDACPQQGGPDWNNGCPTEDAAPVPLDNQDVREIAIPSTSPCSVGASSTTNIRIYPILNTNIIGVLQAGQVVPVLSQIFNQEEQRLWLWIGSGFVAADAGVLGGDCREIPLILLDPNNLNDTSPIERESTILPQQGGDTEAEQISLNYAKVDISYVITSEHILLLGAQSPEGRPILWNINGTRFPRDYQAEEDGIPPLIVDFLPDEDDPTIWQIFIGEDETPILGITSGSPGGFPPGVIIDTTTQLTVPNQPTCLFAGMGLPPTEMRSWVIVDPEISINQLNPDEQSTVFLGFSYVDVTEATQLQITAADANMDDNFGNVDIELSDANILALYDTYEIVNTSLPHNSLFDVSPDETDRYRIFYRVTDFNPPLEVVMQCN